MRDSSRIKRRQKQAANVHYDVVTSQPGGPDILMR